MQVLYIDVYFLINLTVDMISLYVTVKLLKIRTSFCRLLLLSLAGASVAVADALLGKYTWLCVALSVAFLAACFIWGAKGITAVRRVRFVLVFLGLEMLLGGAVSFIYNLLDRYSPEVEEYMQGIDVNRKSLIFALIILLSIGVLKMVVMVFSGEKDLKDAMLKITVGKFTVECEALVDSGNLVRDPMNMNPVIFIKESLASRLIPREVIELSGIDELDYAQCKRIRLVPVTRGAETHVLTGFLPDEVRIGSNVISATLAVDKEEGTYGGREALIPSSVL